MFTHFISKSAQKWDRSRWKWQVQTALWSSGSLPLDVLTVMILRRLPFSCTNRKKDSPPWSGRVRAGFAGAHAVTFYWFLSTQGGLTQPAGATLLAWSCALNFCRWNESMVFWPPDPLPMWQGSQSGKPFLPKLHWTQFVYLIHWYKRSLIWRWLFAYGKDILSLWRRCPFPSVGSYIFRNTFLSRAQGRHAWLLRRAASAARDSPKWAVPKASAHLQWIPVMKAHAPYSI